MSLPIPEISSWNFAGLGGKHRWPWKLNNCGELKPMHIYFVEICAHKLSG